MIAKIRERDAFKEGPVHNILQGSEDCDFEEVDLALAEDPTCINQKDQSSGLTAIHIAAGNGNVAMSKHLLSKPNIDLSIKDNFNRDALDLAIGIGSKEIIEMLSAILYPKSFNTRRMYSQKPKLTP